jgi:hypothetical protein
MMWFSPDLKPSACSACIVQVTLCHGLIVESAVFIEADNQKRFVP